MKKDWYQDWEDGPDPQPLADELVAWAMRTVECEHEWVPAVEAGPGTALSWIGGVCRKCGAVSVNVTPADLEQMLDEGEEDGTSDLDAGQGDS